MSFIVALEGGDGCGKDTQARLTAEYLDAVQFQFPSYDTPYGKLIREHLDRKWDVRSLTAIGVEDTRPALSEEALKDALVFQGLQMANRLEAMPRVQEALLAGRNVVLNRWKESGIVYGTLDGLDKRHMIEAQAFLPQPDLNILLSVNFDIAWSRKPHGRDRYEAKRQFMRDVFLTYEYRWREMIEDGDPSYVVINGNLPVEHVQAAIRIAVDKRMTQEAVR